MKRHFRFFILLSFIGINLLLIGVQTAEAAFQLSVVPRRGGRTIRFENANPGALLRNEEVTVSMTTDRNAQYRIYQTVYQPLTNEFGNVIPQGTFIMFSPSSPGGTLRTQLETPVTMGQMPIYISNAAGTSDEFVLVYNVRVPEDQPGGIYRTQLTLTAELVNAQGGVSPSTITMDVRVEINPTFRIKVVSEKGLRSLDLGHISKERKQASESLKFEVESNIGTTYKVYQQLSSPLVSPDGAMLDEEVFKVNGVGGPLGTLAIGQNAIPVSQAKSLVYTSSAAGAGDIWQLQFTAQPDTSQKAGVYTGTLTITVESQSPYTSSVQSILVPIRIEVDTIFYLDTEVQKGSNLHFGTFKLPGEKHEKQVLITVHSNIGQPYQVTQILPRKLMSETGVVMPKESFTFFGAEAQTGVLAAMSPRPITEGESVVFTSDSKGSPEKFLLNYELALPKDARSGSYSSEVKYSITTL